jgi:hypothetical protein
MIPERPSRRQAAGPEPRAGAEPLVGEATVTQRAKDVRRDLSEGIPGGSA